MTLHAGVPLGLRTVIYHVSDLGRAKAWYAKAFNVAPYFDEPFYVGFTVGGFELGLDPDGSGDAGGAGGVAYWGVASLDAAVAHFIECGADVRSAAQDVGGGIRVATVADPFGNAIGLIENPHFTISAVR
jgi:predicted enzyme related to lactoylglutathione lyase